MQDVMANMMVLPNRKLYKMDAASDFRTYYQHPIGIARITCICGRSFVVEKKLIGKGDVPDVYCNITLGRERAWRTSSVKDNLSPIWNETKDFLLSDHDRSVSIEAWDEDKGSLDADDYLGKACVSVSDLLLAGKTMEVELEQDGKRTGTYVTIHCDVLKFTVNSVSRLEEPKSDNQLAGLLTIIVTRALDLPCEKKDAASCVKITYGKQEFATKVVLDKPGSDACNPVYDEAFLVPLVVGASSHAIKMQLWNGEMALGETVIEHVDLVATPNQTLSMRRQVVGETTIEFSVSLMGVLDAGEEPLVVSDAPTSAVPAKDTIRISIVSGRGFQIKKRLLRKRRSPISIVKSLMDLVRRSGELLPIRGFPSLPSGKTNHRTIQ
jgi:Ca2+-dependent lipid-binding protein